MLARGLVSIMTGVMLATGTTAFAADYRPDDFLTLDLSKAVLSPQRLGPDARFEPVPIEARSDQAVAKVAPEMHQAEQPRTVAATRVHVAKPVARAAQAAPRGAARNKLARRHGNPLDAQAMDTRIQSWPCRGGGGICSWK